MRADQAPKDADHLRRILCKLRARRKKRVRRLRVNRISRRSPNSESRKKVLEKTEGRCHICGGVLEGDDWHADHVLAYAAGGSRSLDNYLPTHSLCNSYRRCFSDVEFQWILKLGVWLRTQIANDTKIGRMAGQRFCQKEWQRVGRRNNSLS